jgi:hypothetical protein
MNQMQEINEKMNATDWLDRNSEHLSTVNINSIKPKQNLSGLEWKATVQFKRQDIINERNKSLSSHSTIKKSRLENKNRNDVKIIDKSYLLK